MNSPPKNPEAFNSSDEVTPTSPDFSTTVDTWNVFTLSKSSITFFFYVD